MNTPPKYEDLVLKVAELERLYDSLVNRSNTDRDSSEKREDALREELERTKKAYEAYGIDFDRSEEKVEVLQQRLTVAEQRAGELEGLLREAATTCRVNDLIISANYFEYALKPAAEPKYTCDGCGSNGWTGNCEKCIPY